MLIVEFTSASIFYQGLGRSQAFRALGLGPPDRDHVKLVGSGLTVLGFGFRGRGLEVYFLTIGKHC